MPSPPTIIDKDLSATVYTIIHDEFSRIETGATKLNLKILVKMSNVLNISPAYLLTGANTKSDDYLNPEINQLLKNCFPAKYQK